VLTAAAMRCLNGEIQGRLVMTPRRPDRMRRMGSPTSSASTAREDLAPGKSIIFAAAGVTDGASLQGVRFFGDGIRTHCS
jgi:fructose-1,6-bisphosphatase II